MLGGAIPQYGDLDNVRGPRNYLLLLRNRACMWGFIVSDYADQYPRAVKEMAEWIAKGTLRHRETIVKGLETFPETFRRRFTGEKASQAPHPGLSLRAAASVA